MTSYTFLVIITSLQYVAEESSPVLVKLLLFNWHNVPILGALAIHFLVSPLNHFSKSMKVMVQCCKKDSGQENFISTE